MSLAAGKLRHRVTIEQQTTTVNTGGESVVVWTAVATNIAAQVAFLSAREFMLAASVQSEITARIVIRYRPGITASMRVKFNGDYYNIAGVLPDLDSGMEYLTLPVTVGVVDSTAAITNIDGGSPGVDPGSSFDGGAP